MAHITPNFDSLYGKINRWQTWLLRLHAGKGDERLQADLLVADIVQIPGIVLHHEQARVNYEAISYCWRESVYDCVVFVNNKEVPITSSLHGGLRRFRLLEGYRYLWADALCINQSNDEEKSVQVQNIFSIFSKATKVLAWLGE